MLALGIDPGSTRGMQNYLNQASVMIELLSEENMKMERRKLRCHGTISVECDTRYNNPIGNPNTPQQYASQAVFSMFENMTREKKVIAIQTASKLCLEGAKLIRQEIKPLCPDHPGCTATISQTQSIGMEDQYAESAANVLKKDDVTLNDVTADGDSRITKGIRRVYGDSVDSLKDAIHFTKAHEKSIARANFSYTMFPGPQKEREKKIKFFAKDLKRRCKAEFDSAFKKCKATKTACKRKKQLKAFLSKTHLAVLRCLQGDCSMCKRHSHVCNATKKKNFRQKSILTEPFKITAGDRRTLLTLILKRLGPQAIDLTHKNSNTQKSESFNRKLNKSYPKCSTFIRSYRGRVGAAILDNNLGFTGCLSMMHRVAQHKVSANIKKKIAITEKFRNYSRMYQRTSAFKRKRALRRLGLFRLYVNSRFTSETKGYKKDVTIYSK